MELYEILKDTTKSGEPEDKQLGSGASGTVMKVIRRSDNTEWALKKIRLEDGAIITAAMFREGCIMGDIYHPNIVKLEQSFIHDGNLCFVLELLDHTLGEHISGQDHYRGHTKTFMGNILSAVAHLHSRNIFHRDLKMSNLLVQDHVENTVVKITDFGLARGFIIAHDRLSSELGTLTYMAPEVILGSNSYDASADLWSVGVVFAELLQIKKHSLLHGHTEVEILRDMFQ